MGWTRCAECGKEFDYRPHSDKFCKDEDTGEALCEHCTSFYNDVAEKIMIKAFRQMPTLNRQAFAIERLSGLGELFETIKEEREDY